MACVAVADASSPFVSDEGKSEVCSSMGVWLPLCVPSPSQTATAALGTFPGAEALAEDLPVAFSGLRLRHSTHVCLRQQQWDSGAVAVAVA